MEADAFRSKNRDRIDKWKAEFDRLGSESVFRVVPDTDTTARIYDRLSLEFGQNIEFLEKLPPWKGWPLNPSAIYARPLIKHRGDYYLFHVPLVKRSALRLIEGIIEDVDESYWRESFLRKRDEYLENASVELFRRLLPGSEYFQNLHYDCIEEGQAKRAEVDGLFIFDDTLLIVGAKASKFSDEARRGAIKSLKSDLDAIIDTAYRQGSRELELVRSTKDVPFFDETGKEVLRVRLSNFERAFLVSVSLEKLSSLSTSLFALRTLGLIQGREWPWSVALNDLRVIAEITDHPTTFLHYLTRRVACNAFEQLTASDELDMFAHYMQLGLFFENDEQFKSTDLYMIASHTEDIDHYYEFQQGLRKEVPKPKISMMPRFEQLISTLETVRPRNFVSACLALLDFDDATRSKVAEQIDAIEEAEEKGRTRIVALPFGSRGDALILGNGNVNILLNSSTVIPVWVAAIISSNPFSPPAKAAFMSSPRKEANGSLVFHSGCCGASAFTRSMANRNWKYNGCSAHSVPSLSNVAMRSGTGTKSDEPSFVTFSTKATIAFFGAVSFHDGRGSAALAMPAVKASAAASAAAMRFFVCVVFMVRSKIDAAGYDRNENECFSSHSVLGVDVDHIPPSRRRIRE